MEDVAHGDNDDDTEEGEGCLPGLLDLPPEPLRLLLPPLRLLHHPGEQLGRGRQEEKRGNFHQTWSLAEILTF